MTLCRLWICVELIICLFSLPRKRHSWNRPAWHLSRSLVTSKVLDFNYLWYLFFLSLLIKTNLFLPLLSAIWHRSWNSRACHADQNITEKMTRLVGCDRSHQREHRLGFRSVSAPALIVLSSSGTFSLAARMSSKPLPQLPRVEDHNQSHLPLSCHLLMSSYLVLESQELKSMRQENSIC